jgi:hypothetical protein
MFKRFGRALAAGGFVLRDVVGLCGAGSVSYGAWLLHPAAGFIVGGGLLMIGAWMHARVAG